jgi:hypothetical protein
MDSFHLAWLLSIVLGVTAQLGMMVLQAKALRQYAHSSFRRLLAGSLMGLVGLLIYAVPYFIKLKTPQLAPVFWGALLLSVGNFVFGLWGTASLFRQYGVLLASGRR